mmetsp:Transcript_57347/g.94837  ORF Transcript_57347/g.94837 Transcript_57347/m.94837 type:complete len:276 (-) Transcript_57347:340-1167(-)
MAFGPRAVLLGLSEQVGQVKEDPSHHRVTVQVKPKWAHAYTLLEKREVKVQQKAVERNPFAPNPSARECPTATGSRLGCAAVEHFLSIVDISRRLCRRCSRARRDRKIQTQGWHRLANLLNGECSIVDWTPELRPLRVDIESMSLGRMKIEPAAISGISPIYVKSIYGWLDRQEVTAVSTVSQLTKYRALQQRVFGCCSHHKRVSSFTVSRAAHIFWPRDNQQLEILERPRWLAYCHLKGTSEGEIGAVLVQVLSEGESSLYCALIEFEPRLVHD